MPQVFELKPDTILEVSNIEKDVDFAQPHLISKRRVFNGTHSTVVLVKNKKGALAARKHIHQHQQEWAVGDGKNLATAELELLQAVSRKPHMPTFLGSAQAKDVLYLYYQPWGARTLRQFLDNPSTTHPCHTPRQLAAQYMLCLSRAMHLIHASRPPIVHRDLKPENFILTEDDEIFVIDFGLGKLCVESTASYAGTKDYMAPEVAKVRKNRAYWLSVRRVREWMDLIVRSNPELMPYNEIISKMLEEKPLDRPTFAEIHDHLRKRQPSHTCCADELPCEDEADSPSTTASTTSEEDLVVLEEMSR
ncbi:serine/threonine protein kinase psk1, partial [Quaeritorhiza haematococci]